MIALGGKAETPEAGYRLAEAALTDGAGLAAFMKMVDLQGGDVSVFNDMGAFHKPGATLKVEAWESGYAAEMDTTALGWAVQRTGAGREKAGEPVDPHAGILFHARRGARVEKGQPFATIYATNEEKLSEPAAILKQAVHFSKTPPDAVALVSRIITRENAEDYLRNAVD
jgi:pyrimidine-nucleoside phosphorylase